MISFRVEVVVGSDSLFLGKDKLESFWLVFDVMVTNPDRTHDSYAFGAKSGGTR